MTPIRAFFTLFVGRTDAIGMDEGGCDRDIIAKDWQGGHFISNTPIGIYPMVHFDDGWMVHWGCVDLDVKREGKNRWDYETERDAHIAAFNLQLALRELGIIGWREITKSHGRHVWVFSRHWVHASTMRRALLVACQVAEVPPTEVNPKSEGFDDPATLGNYVRLPYPAVAGNNRFICGYDGTPFGRDEFVGKALSARTSTDTLTAVADLYVPPTPRVALVEGGEYDGELNDDVTPYIKTVLENGPINHTDRSGWLWWLAGRCLDESLSAECALAVLTAADDTWTRKYTSRRDGPERLVQIVEKLYG